MADFSIIADVSNELIKTLRESLCPEPLQSPEAIQLASPADKNADFQLGLFLYDVQEFSEYRVSAPVRTSDNRKQMPPKPLQLYYMLFVNSKAQIAAGAESEQRVIGCAIQTLADRPFLTVAAGAGEQGQENAALTFSTLTFDDKSKIWSALSSPYQVGVFFSVSPVNLSSKRSQRFTRVTSTQVEINQK